MAGRLVDVMFEKERNIDRAYVALPVQPEEGVTVAARWVLERAGSLSEVNLRVPQRGLVDDVPALAELRRRGVRLSGERRTSANAVGQGPLIVYCPDLESLAQAEEVWQATAIVAVGLDDGLRPWVSAFRPACLAGHEITPADPLVSDPVVWQAMRSFTTSINSSTGLSRSTDRSRVTDGLQKLLAAEHVFDPDELMAAALRLNRRGSAAWELRKLAGEIASGKRKRVGDGTYRADIVQVWEQQAAT